jgi:two-component system, sensor histidine kinase and response regulator
MMQDKINRILFSKVEKSFEERIFIYANLVSAFACIIAVFLNLMLDGIFFVANISIALACLGYTLILLYTRKNKLTTFTFFIYLILTLSILSIVWFQAGGIDSPVVAYYFLAMLVVIFLGSTSNQIFSVIIIYIGLVANIITEYYFPLLVKRYPDPLTEFYDITINYLFTLLFLGILAYIFKRNYNKERLNSQMKNEELLILTQEIREQNERLALANRTKDKLFSIIAHDLRNPVAALRNTIDILDPAILNSEELEFVKGELTKQFESMDFTLTNLLTWARNQLAGEQVNKEKIPIHSFLKDKIKLFAPTIYHKEIKVENKIDSSLSIFADPNHIQFVLRNLLNNAIKFSENQSVITAFSIEEKQEIIIGIQDRGIGISQANQQKLFDAHTNFSTNGTQGEKGTGLGLVLCKEFIEKNDGKIWLESEIGKGSIFYFSLPKL